MDNEIGIILAQVILYALMFGILFVIYALVARWIFGVNHIVARLDKIIRAIDVLSGCCGKG